MSTRKELLIGRILRLYPAEQRTCEDATQAKKKGRCGCLLFQWNQAEADASAIAEGLNAVAGQLIIKSQGTCRATGGKVTHESPCGIGDGRFKIGMSEQLP